MTILIIDLNIAASRTQPPVIEKSFFESLTQKRQTAFLCHSHEDEDLAKGLQILLAEEGWEISIDWQKSKMPDKPNQENALIIKNKIVEADWFLFLATPNSTNLKWCSWAIGYADSKKEHSQILIIPTKDQEGKEYGCEYHNLYTRLDTGSSLVKTSGFAVYAPDSDSGTWINTL